MLDLCFSKGLHVQNLRSVKNISPKVYKGSFSFSLTVQSMHSTMMDHQIWITSVDMATLKVQWIVLFY